MPRVLVKGEGCAMAERMREGVQGVIRGFLFIESKGGWVLLSGWVSVTPFN